MQFQWYIKPLFLYLCCYCHNSDFYVLCAHSYRFIIIILYSCLFNNIENKRRRSPKYINSEFYIYLCKYLSLLVFLFLPVVSSYSLMLSFQPEEVPLASLTVSSTSVILPQFLFIWKYFNFSIIFEEQFCQISSTFFSTLNVLSHCLLAYIVSDVKSVVNLIENHLYMMNCFSLAASRVLCLLTI